MTFTQYKQDFPMTNAWDMMNQIEFNNQLFLLFGTHILHNIAILVTCIYALNKEIGLTKNK